MKTSNKIFVGLLSVVALYFLVFALDLRFFGEHKSNRNRHGPKFEIHTIDIGDFKHVYIDNVKWVEIVKGDANYIEIRYTLDSAQLGYLTEKLIQFEPEYRGDTLVLKSPLKYPHLGNYKVYLKNDISNLEAKNSRFTISGFQKEHLNIKLDNANLDINKSCKMLGMTIAAVNNSKIYAHKKMKLDTLNLALNNSKAYFKHSMKKLSVELKEKSTLDIRHADDITIKKDRESRIYMR